MDKYSFEAKIGKLNIRLKLWQLVMILFISLFFAVLIAGQSI